MILPYRDEMDLSLTKYSDDWKAAHLVDDPEYTEDIQRFDRWCRRCYELGRKQELNEAYKLSNDNERRRRREPNEFLERRLSKILGEEYSGEKVFGDGNTHFTNEGFNPDWMDEELKEHGLYTPDIELVKKWFKLVVFENTKNRAENMRTGFIEGEMKNTIVHAVELEKDLEEFWEKEAED